MSSDKWSLLWMLVVRELARYDQTDTISSVPRLRARLGSLVAVGRMSSDVESGHFHD